LDAASTLRLQGDVLAARKDREGALAKYEAAIERIERVRKTVASASAFVSRGENYRTYESVVKLLVEMSRPREAFNYLSRLKSKELQESVRPSSIKTEDRQLQEFLRRADEVETKEDILATRLQTEEAK